MNGAAAWLRSWRINLEATSEFLKYQKVRGQTLHSLDIWAAHRLIYQDKLPSQQTRLDVKKMTSKRCENVQDAETSVSVLRGQTLCCIPLLQPGGIFELKPPFAVSNLSAHSDLWPLTPDTHQHRHCPPPQQLSLTGYCSYLESSYEKYENLRFVKFSDQPAWHQQRNS